MEFFTFITMKGIWNSIWPLMKNKYVIALVAFGVWIMFFSQYSLMDRYRLSRTYKQLQQEKEYYLDQVRQDSTRLLELTTDSENLEKFAREQYYMKKPDEDIFVVVE